MMVMRRLVIHCLKDNILRILIFVAFFWVFEGKKKFFLDLLTFSIFFYESDFIFMLPIFQTNLFFLASTEPACIS